MKHYAYNSPFEMKDQEGNEYLLTVERDDYAADPREEWDNLCTMTCWHRDYRLGDKHSFDDADEFLERLCYEVLHKDDDELYGLSSKDKLKMLQESNLILIKPINMYDHSGITVSTSNGYPYNDRWDAGCVGFIYVTKKKIFDEGCCLLAKDDNGDYIRIEHKHENAPSTYSHKTIPTTEENWKEVADHYIECEMETYDQYLRGDVYGYTLTKKVVVQEECPHCGQIISEEEEWEEEDSCYGFYGSCIEDNGILDNIGNLKFVEEE